VHILPTFEVHAQTVNPRDLPNCPKADRSITNDLQRFAKWNNCWGRYEFAFEPKGDIYEGEFINGLPNGFGRYFYLANNHFKGRKYSGIWKDGKYHGRGNFTHANGDEYRGEFSYGEVFGEGTYTFSNGENYALRFGSDGWGEGPAPFADGRQFRGIPQNLSFSRK